VELALNLLWFAVSALLVVCWLRFPSRKLATGISRGLILVACVSLLLFAPISISDDLHASFDAVEEVSVSARKAHPLPAVQSSCGVPVAPLAAPSFRFVEEVAEGDFSLPPFVLAASAVSRAPPAA